MSAASPSLPSAKDKPGENVNTSEGSDKAGDELPSEAAVAAARHHSSPGVGGEGDTGDDEGSGGGGGEGGGGGGSNGDSPLVKRYSREELMEMRTLPLSRRRPDCLPEIYSSAISIWDVNKKRSETPNDDERGGREGPGDKRRSGDPRERIRKESEGIVLSPCRRSFNSGCFVGTGGGVGVGASGASGGGGRHRADSPVYSQQGDGLQKPDLGSRDSVRRIGSGRIIARDMVPWERGGDAAGDSNTTTEYAPYRPPAVARERDDRYERRSFGRDLYGGPPDKNRNDRDRDRDLADSRFSDRRDRDETSHSRYNNRRNNRVRQYDKDEEPEWFSSGPTSQHETIELRGFDEPAPASTAAATTTTNSNSNTTATSQASSQHQNTTSSGTNAANSNVEARTRPTRKSAGSGRTPSAIAANQTKEQPQKIMDKFEEEIDKQRSSSPQSTDAKNNQKNNDNSNKNSSAENGGISSDAPLDFNLEEFLKLDDIPDLLSNGGSEEGLTSSSRFSQWFRRESPTPTSNITSGDSAQDKAIGDQLASIMNDNMDNTSISIPTNDSQHVFAPISPAASTTSGSNVLLELLTRGQQQYTQPQQQQFQHTKPSSDSMPGKIHSLEELEARMRGGNHNHNIHQQQQLQQQWKQQQQMQQFQLHQQLQQIYRAPQQIHHQPQVDEVNAFKRMMEQVGHAVPASNGPVSSKSQPMSIMQMLNKSQQADQAAMEANVHQDVLFKLLQNQQEQANKIMQGNVNHSSRHYQVSPIPTDLQIYINGLQPSRELLQRPEAQAIMNGLKQGEITPQLLMQQMSSPGMQSRKREVIGSILKVYHQDQLQQNSSPRNNRLLLPQQQQLRVSPLPPNAIPQRIPSPRELQVHTQNIMQAALIKKKLEEQREKFLRRQEQSGQPRSLTPTNPNPPMPMPSPTKHQQAAIAFTPTSVLRKMTAEKESDQVSMVLSNAKSGVAGWGAPPLHVPKQGRPIVKGNAGGMPPVQSYQPNPADFQPVQYMNHHQQLQQQQQQAQQRQQEAAVRAKMAGHAQQSHQQINAQLMQMHRQQHQQHAPQTMPQQSNRIGPMGGNGTPNAIRQLLMQSQRNLNESGGRVPGRTLSPTSNQLARWFSPELLAQATAGKLPSVNMAHNVVSLEELERMQHNEAIVHN